jgi:hypothetical protein
LYASISCGWVAWREPRCVAVVAYNAAAIGVFGAPALFAHLSLGMHLSWQVCR